MSKENFVKGAAVLGAAGLLVKILGAIYRLPLTNWIGTEGMGYFQPAYNVYNLLLAISLAGFPTAIARLVSEKRALDNYKGAYQVYRVSLLIMFVIGLVSSLFILIFGRQIVSIMKCEGSYYSLLALTPALFVVPILSSYRGFFQGSQNMVPIALSQIFEQLFRVVVGLVLAYGLVKVGLQEAAAGATFGASIGSVVALSVIFIFFVRRKGLTKKEILKASSNSVDTTKNIVKALLVIAIPITIGASISPLMGVFDQYFVFSRLPLLGYTEKQIVDMYGQLSGTAHTLINFPQVFSTAIAMSLVPIITEAFATKDKLKLNQTSDIGVKISLIIALPCGVGLFMLAEPIIALLFSNIGADKFELSGQLLQILSISVIFLIMVQAFTAMLQSVNKQLIPVKNLFIGLIIKTILSYVLISIPSINIKGAALSTAITYFVVALLNFRDIKKYTPIKLNGIVKVAALPLLSTVIMAIIVWVTFNFGGIIISSSKLLTLVSIGFGGLAYVIALFVTGAITSEDLNFIPMGSKLKRFVRR